jgi:hypothetical protein
MPPLPPEPPEPEPPEPEPPEPPEPEPPEPKPPAPEPPAPEPPEPDTEGAVVATAALARGWSVIVVVKSLAGIVDTLDS